MAKSQSIVELPRAEHPIVELPPEDRPSTPIESLDLTAGELLFHVAAVAKAQERSALALERLADKFAPIDPIRGVHGRPATITCPRGHGMQATDEYCQHCFRQDRVKPRVA